MRFSISKPSDSDGDDSKKKKLGEADDTPNARTDYEVLEGQLKYQFEDRPNLVRALTHRSAHQKGEKSDYERLEFLGDAVLDLAVAHLLLQIYDTAKEGELSKM